MKKFEFKLQRLLDFRKAKEKEIHNELAKLLSVQNRERERQEYYRKSIDEQHIKLVGRIKGGQYSYSEVQSFEHYFDFAAKAIKAQQEKIESMEPEIKKIRERLIESSKERKVVERLKERRYQEFLYEYNREVMKENDESNQKIYMNKLLEANNQG